MPGPGHGRATMINPSPDGLPRNTSMFDIGFSELVVIAVVALVVLGPERLPKVARTAGHLLGRLQRYVNDVKSDIHREMQLDELRRLQAEVKDSAAALETSLRSELSQAKEAVGALEHSLQESLTSVQGSTASFPVTPAPSDAWKVETVESGASPESDGVSPSLPETPAPALRRRFVARASVAEPESPAAASPDTPAAG